MHDNDEHTRLADACEKLVLAIDGGFTGDLPGAMEAMAKVFDECCWENRETLIARLEDELRKRQWRLTDCRE